MRSHYDRRFTGIQLTDPVGITVPIRRYRVLFSDGEVQDFLAASDSSDVRGTMFQIHFGHKSSNVKASATEAIVGVVDMGLEYEHHPGQERLDV